MLACFCGKYPLRQYIHSKPTRYGIKIYALVRVDAETLYYLRNLEVYAENQKDEPYNISNKTANIVKRMTKAFPDFS